MPVDLSPPTLPDDATPRRVAKGRVAVGLARRLSGALAATLVLAGAAGLDGCAMTPIEPWVKPYERERLADPIMQFSRGELSARDRDHVYTVREGARGATGVQGGGCGCN